MNLSLENLNETQNEFLCGVMDSGGQQVSSILEMLTSKTVEEFSVKVHLIPSSKVSQLMAFSPDPVAIAQSGIQGDLEGVFYFLQSKPDFQSLGELMISGLSAGEIATQSDLGSYMGPDWLNQNDKQNKVEIDTSEQILDATSELGNMLFGGYLTALYTGCHLAVFYDPPTTQLDDQHLLLGKALKQNEMDCNTAFVMQIEYLIAQKKLRSWLLLLPDTKGLQAMLDGIDTD
jgi:chemotaxis protein CheY-P-specific phosphatase CheC